MEGIKSRSHLHTGSEHLFGSDDDMGLVPTRCRYLFWSQHDERLMSKAVGTRSGGLPHHEGRASLKVASGSRLTPFVGLKHDKRLVHAAVGIHSGAWMTIGCCPLCWHSLSRLAPPRRRLATSTPPQPLTPSPHPTLTITNVQQKTPKRLTKNSNFIK